MPDTLQRTLDEIRGKLQTVGPTAPPISLDQQLDEQLGITRTYLEQSPRTISPPVPPKEQLHRISSIVDGDTIDIENIGRVRLTSLFAPETVHPERGVEYLGPEASMLAKAMLTGQKVRVDVSPEGRDVYGRTLAKLYLPDGREVNAELQAMSKSYKGAGGAGLRDEDKDSFPSYVPEEGAAARSIAHGLFDGAMRGLLYPVSALIPKFYESVNAAAERDRRVLRAFIEQQSDLSDTEKNIFAGAPGVAGELAGFLIPGAPLFQGTRALFNVKAATSMAGKAARSVGAATAAGGLFSAMAKLDNGESRISRVARDATLVGATEAVFLPLFLRGWRAELGPSKNEFVESVRRSLGWSKERAEAAVTLVRSGLSPTDSTVNEAVLRAARAVPAAQQSPVVLQAAKALDARDALLPKTPPIIDPQLPGTILGKFNLRVGDTKIPYVVTGIGPGRDAQAVFAELDSLRDNIATQLQLGVRVELSEPVFADVRTYNSFVSRLVGQVSKPSVGKPPGTAPKGTVSELGTMPSVGDTVTAVRDSGTRASVTIVEAPRPSLPSRVEPEARLAVAGFTGEQITQLSELDKNVAAAFLSSSKFGVRGEQLREHLAAKGQIAAEFSPEDVALASHTMPAQSGLDQLTYLTALTRHVMDGGALSPRQQARFPYLRQLAKWKAVEPTEATVEVIPNLERMRQEYGFRWQKEKELLSEKVVKPLKIEAGGRSEGEVFYPQPTSGRALPEVPEVLTAEKRAEIQGHVLRWSKELETQVEPARRSQLKLFISTAEERLKAGKLTSPLEPGTPREGKPPAGMFVGVNKQTGEKEMLRLDQMIVQVPARPGEVAPPKALLAHSSGEERRGVVNLDVGEVHLEGLDMQDARSWYRSTEFQVVDITKDFGRDVPIFVQSNGTVTYSVAPVTYYRTPTTFGGPADWGPLDLVEAKRNLRQLYQKADKLGIEERPPEFGRFHTTYVPRALRRPAEEVRRQRPQLQARTELPEGLEFEGFEALEEGLEAPIRSARKSRTIPLSREDVRGMRISGLKRTAQLGLRGPSGKAAPLERPDIVPSYMLSKDMLTSPHPNPEWATVRRTARVMLKEGYDPATPINVRITHDRHVGIPDPPLLTIGEAADLELPMPLLDQLYEEAHARGYTVLPRGAGTVLRTPEGTERVFNDALEALEAVGRIPLMRSGVDLDAPLARTWNMGLRNGIDSWVDTAKHQDVKFYDLAISQVYKGQRPLVEFHSLSSKDLLSTYRAMDRLFPVPPFTERIKLRTMMFDATGGEYAVMYDPQQVGVILNRYRNQLARLGVRFPTHQLGDTTISAPGQMDSVIKQLYELPNGLDILKGRDPESSIMYTWYRMHSMRNAWEEGAQQLDELGPFRSFTKEQKSVFSFRRCA